MVIFDLEYKQTIAATSIQGGDSWLDSWFEEFKDLFPPDFPTNPPFGTIVSSSTFSTGGSSITHTSTYEPGKGWRHYSHSKP